MTDDLRHLDKTLQRHEINAQAARRDAETAQRRAHSYRQAGNDDSAAAHDAIAIGLLAKAKEHEKEAERANEVREQVNQRISDLESERERVRAEYDQKLKDIDSEIMRERGSMQML